MRNARRALWALAAVGFAAWGRAIMVGPRVAGGAYLALFAWALSIALGMMALLMIVYASGGRWIDLWIPQAEHASRTIVALAPLFLPVLLLARVIYPWAGAHVPMSAEAAHQLVVARPWLNLPFMVVRAVIYFAAWIWLFRRVRRDRGAGASGAGLVVLAFTLTFASIDWLVALTPGWFSTIFGVLYFAGGFLGALGLLAVMAWRRDAGLPPARRADPERLHKLGNMLLTAVVFWLYIAFSQYLVFWIAGIPRDITWYVSRTSGAWLAMAVALFVAQFVVPFLLLLFVPVKRNAAALAAIGGWLVLTHLVETWWMVMPSIHPDGPVASWPALAALLAVGGCCGALLVTLPTARLELMA